MMFLILRLRAVLLACYITFNLLSSTGSTSIERRQHEDLNREARLLFKGSYLGYTLSDLNLRLEYLTRTDDFYCGQFEALGANTVVMARMSTLASRNLELADSKAMEDVDLIKFAITAFTTESLSSKSKMGLSSHGGTSVNQYPKSANESSTWKRGLLWGSIALGVIVILLSLVLCSYFAYQKYANPTTTAEKGLKDDLDSKTREYLYNTQGSPRSSIVHSSTFINPTPQQALIRGLSNTRTSSHSLLSYTQSFNNTNSLGAGHPTSCIVTNTAPSIFEYGASFKEKKARKDNEKKGQRLTRQKSMGDKDSSSGGLGAITLDPLPSQVEDHLNSYAGSPKQTATRMDSGFSFSSQTTVKGNDNSNCQLSETLNLTEQIVARLGSPPPRRQRNRSTSTGSDTSRLNVKSENSVNYRTKPPTEPVKLDSVVVAQSPITEDYAEANARDKIPEAKPAVKVDNSLSTGLTVVKSTIRPPKSPLCQRSPSNLFREATLSATDNNPRTTSTTSVSSAESCARSQTEMAYSPEPKGVGDPPTDTTNARNLTTEAEPRAVQIQDKCSEDVDDMLLNEESSEHSLGIKSSDIEELVEKLTDISTDESSGSIHRALIKKRTSSTKKRRKVLTPTSSVEMKGIGLKQNLDSNMGPSTPTISGERGSSRRKSKKMVLRRKSEDEMF